MVMNNEHEISLKMLQRANHNHKHVVIANTIDPYYWNLTVKGHD